MNKSILHDSIPKNKLNLVNMRTSLWAFFSESRSTHLIIDRRRNLELNLLILEQNIRTPDCELNVKRKRLMMFFSNWAHLFNWILYLLLGVVLLINNHVYILLKQQKGEKKTCIYNQWSVCHVYRMWLVSPGISRWKGLEKVIEINNYFI